MAGILTHLYVGNEILNRQRMKSPQIRNHFLLGNFMPDAAYWPGENSLFSDLSHYLSGAKIPELLYQNAPDENWQAFARGWLLHLKTDLTIHPMINKFAAKYYYGENYSDQVLTYEMDHQIHALIESGLDRQLLSRIDADVVSYRSPCLNRNFDFADLLNEVYPVDFKNTVIFDLLTRSSSRLKFYYKCFLNLGKNRILKFSMRNLIKFFRIFLSSSTYQLLRSFPKPYKFDIKSFDKYSIAVEKLIENESSKIDPLWLEADYNFDTGGFSVLGEYGLADKLFTDINRRTDERSLIWTEFRRHFLKNKEY